MNILNFNYKIGWPFSADTMEFVQNQLLQLQQLSLIGGNLFIISGCNVVGGNVSDGWVVINGEVLPFMGGAVQTSVIVVDTPTGRGFQDLSVRNYYHVRHATFGTSTTQFTWADFERNNPTNGLIKRVRIAEGLIDDLRSDLEDQIAAFNEYTPAWADITGKPNSLLVYATSYELPDSGDIGASIPNRTVVTIPIPAQADTNYIINGSLYCYDAAAIAASDNVLYTVFDKQLSSFKVSFREISGSIQKLRFDFSVVKIS